MEHMPSKLKPALIGGAVIGTLSAMPVLGGSHCVCCLWILTGGFLAGTLYSKALPANSLFQSGDGAIVGMLSGFYGALFKSFLFYLLQNLGIHKTPVFEDFMEVFQEVLRINPELQTGDLFQGLAEGEINMAIAVAILMRDLFIGMLFGVVGGLISVRLSNRKKSSRNNGLTIV